MIQSRFFFIELLLFLCPNCFKFVSLTPFSLFAILGFCDIGVFCLKLENFGFLCGSCNWVVALSVGIGEFGGICNIGVLGIA